MATIGIASMLAQKMQQSFANKFFELYQVPLIEEEVTPEHVLKYLNGPANVYKTIYEEENVVLETAPLCHDTPQPNLKWVAPMQLCRQYVQEFLPTNPYDEKKDEFISTPLAKRFEEECGAVVYAMRSHTKQLHFLYNCVSNFVRALQGKILIVGDNGGAIAYRTQFEHTYVMFRDQPDWELICDIPDQRRHCILYKQDLETIFQRQRFDHIVVFLYSHELDYPLDSRVHYISLLSGNGGIVKMRKKNEFNVNGKVTTLHPDPIGSIVCHTSFFPVHDPLDNFVIWFTDLFPSRDNSASLTPLTNNIRLGPVQHVMISDKLDGDLFYLNVELGKMAMLNDKFEVIKNFGKTDLVEQRLILEKVGEKYYVTEPLFYSGLSYFSEWLKLGAYPISKNFGFKRWHPFPVDLNWQKFAKSGEGVVIKSRKCLIGSRDYAFRKLQTYFVKLPARVSYEDKVEIFHSQDRKEFVYRGQHNIYTDPKLVYKGPGVYEINFRFNTLYRKRDKIFADPAWYVESVSMSLDFSRILTVPLKFTEFTENTNQGLGGMIRIKSHRVAASHILDDNKYNQITVSFPAEIGSMLVYLNKTYSVCRSFEGHCVGVLMS